MTDVVSPDRLSPEQSELVRELYDTFTVFKAGNKYSLPLDETKHSHVVTKATTLFAEFPELASLAKTCQENADAEEPEDLNTDLEGLLYWLFLSLHDFAATTDTGKLEYSCVYLESHLIDLSEFCAD
jgi:hypothetical protein